MNILFLYAHADDEALGAGGTIPKWIGKGHAVQLITLSDGLIAKRKGGGDNRAAFAAACKILGIADHRLLGFPDQAFETVPVADLVNAVAEVASPFDLVVTHDAGDLNRDHRIVAEVARVLARPRGRRVGILASEIPFSSAWNGNTFHPNFFVDIGAELDTKLQAFAAYPGEIRNDGDPFSTEGLEALARFRGMESGCKYAEAFKVIRYGDNLVI